MKHIVTKTLCVVAVLFAMNIGVSGHPQNVDTRIGRLDLELGVPTKETVAKLYDDMDFQRACQAYLWALPSVGFEYVLREQRNVLGAKNGDVVIYKGYQNVGRFLTPNVTTPYTLYFYCTIDCDVSVKSA